MRLTQYGFGLAALFALLALQAALAGSAVADGAIEDRFEDFVRGMPSVLEQAGIPGMAIAVVEAGKSPRVTAFGVRRNPGGPPVGTETLFEAASLTKPLFSYGVLRLVERGGLDLDRPLTDYLDFPDVEGDERVNRITARIVLSHTTGFPNWRRNRPLSIGPDPGTQFGYSGEGFVFLQKVVEKITGQPLGEFLGKQVLEPLGMTSSYLKWSDDLVSRTANGHDFVGATKPKWKPAEANAASTLHTTAGDYARFLAEMMNPTLVEARLVEEMLTPQSNAADAVFWGLGWGLEDSRLDDGSTERMFWHWGSNGYFKCFTLSSPQRGLGLVFFTNSENGLSITTHVVERIFGSEHPALTWRAWTEYDSPAFRIQRALAAAGIERGGEGVRNDYEKLLKTYALDSFEESMMNRLGYSLLDMQARDAAVEIFRLNTTLYPESWNAYDSLGEGLAVLGKTDEAISSYQKSLDLNPENANGRQMLRKLQSETERTSPDAGP